MDEVFGAENLCGLISYQKTTFSSSVLLPQLFDYIVWYARDKERVKYRQLFDALTSDESREKFRYVAEGGLAAGKKRMMNNDELAGRATLPEVQFRSCLITLRRRALAQGTSVDFDFEGRVYNPGHNLHWKTTPDGLASLARQGRLFAARNSLRFVRLPSDFPFSPN